MKDLYVYGTLCNDEVVNALVGKTFRKSPASIKGFFVSKLADRYSPGLIKKEGAIAHGYILHDVDDKSFNTIKLWENGDYDLIKVSIREDKNRECFTFLWKSKSLVEPWQNDYFRNNHLDWYLEVDIPKFKKKHLT